MLIALKKRTRKTAFINQIRPAQANQVNWPPQTDREPTDREPIDREPNDRLD